MGEVSIPGDRERRRLFLARRRDAVRDFARDLLGLFSGRDRVHLREVPEHMAECFYLAPALSILAIVFPRRAMHAEAEPQAAHVAVIERANGFKFALRFDGLIAKLGGLPGLRIFG